MAVRSTVSTEHRRSRPDRHTGQTDQEFLISLIEGAKLPATEVVKAQLAWILKQAADPSPIIARASFVAGGHKTLGETVNDLREALRTIKRVRTKLANWSEGFSEADDFYRAAVRTALRDSVIIPEEMIASDGHAHYARRVELHLPEIPDWLDDELKKIETFAKKGSDRVGYDPNERTLVQLLWLVFETSGCRVPLNRRSNVKLSLFQHACVAIFDRANFVYRLASKPETKISRNFPKRIGYAVQAGRENKVLDHIKQVMANECHLRVADVPMIMGVWADWLCGLPISVKAGP